MFRRYFLHGLVAGTLAALAGIIYYRIYFFATLVDFSSILGVPRIVSLNILYCLIAAFLNWFLDLWLKKRGEIVFNFIFSVLSFVLIIVPLSMSLPLEFEFPELFPGLAVPMIFFPAVSWYTVAPFFRS
jgi:hypothetical protein